MRAADVANMIRREVLEAKTTAAADAIIETLSHTAMDRAHTVLRDRVEVLSQIGILMALSDRLRDDLQAWVSRARALGVSWSDIAQAAGVSPQSANRRWDPDAKQKHRDYQRMRTAKNQRTTAEDTSARRDAPSQ